MATQGETITEVRSRVDDEDSLSFTDAELRRWINEGVKNVARDTEALLTFSDISATAGTATYNFPSDLIRHHLMVWLEATNDDDRGIVEYVDRNTFNAIGPDPQGVPRYYTSWGYPGGSSGGAQQFRVYPAPNEAGTFRLYYYKSPADLATADNTDANTELDLPAGWHDIVADYVEVRCLRKSRDPRWQEAAGIYDANLQRLKEIATRYTDQAGQMGSPNLIGIDPWIWGGDEGWW